MIIKRVEIFQQHWSKSLVGKNHDQWTFFVHHNRSSWIRTKPRPLVWVICWTGRTKRFCDCIAKWLSMCFSSAFAIHGKRFFWALSVPYWRIPRNHLSIRNWLYRILVRTIRQTPGLKTDLYRFGLLMAMILVLDDRPWIRPFMWVYKILPKKMLIVSWKSLMKRLKKWRSSWFSNEVVSVMIVFSIL